MHCFKNKDFVEIWLQVAKTRNSRQFWESVKNTIGENTDSSNEQRLREKYILLCRNVNGRWTQAPRCKDCLKKNATWLKQTFRF